LAIRRNFEFEVEKTYTLKSKSREKQLSEEIEILRLGVQENAQLKNKIEIMEKTLDIYSDQTIKLSELVTRILAHLQLDTTSSSMGTPPSNRDERNENAMPTRGEIPATPTHPNSSWDSSNSLSNKSHSTAHSSDTDVTMLNISQLDNSLSIIPRRSTRIAELQARILQTLTQTHP